jgi:prephenate dehydratase
MIRIAYQGAPGAFSQLAARERFPEARTLPRADFASVMRSVRDGTAEFGILPVRNSIIGQVPGAVEALTAEAGLHVVDELDWAITQCLLALPGTTLDVLRTVESHPAALAQCARYLSARRLTPRPVEDTAGAARRIATDRDFTRAAIASEEAGEYYGLVVLQRDIADAPDNRTTFAIVSRERATAAA